MYRLQNDWLYNQSLLHNRFVTRDLSLAMLHLWQLHTEWNAQQQLVVNDYAANRTRIILYNAAISTRFNPSWQHQIFPTVAIGFTSDKRFNYTDKGLYYKGLLQYNFVGEDSTWQGQIYAQMMRADIKPRQNEALNFAAGLSKNFNDLASVELAAAYKSRKVEDYALPFIQSILSDTLNAKLQLYYTISPNLSFKSFNHYEIPNRRFDYRSLGGDTTTRRNNNAYQQSELLSVQELVWINSKIKASAKVEIRQRDRTYQRKEDETKDIREFTTTWYYAIRYVPNRKHTFDVNTFAQLLRVDTRSELNNQDRDEVVYNGEIAYNTRWTSHFRTTLKTSGAYKHLIYIDASQSVENYIERIIRLEPSFQWRKKNFFWNGQYSIWATYNVRDFASEQDKNRANRIFILSHQGGYDLSKKYTLLADLLRRENRLGLLNWKKFAETPLDTVVTYDASMRLQRQFQGKNQRQGRIQIGYRVFRQSRRSTAGLTKATGGNVLIGLHNIIIQHGPRLILAWQKNETWNIEADIWLQKSVTKNKYDLTAQSYIGSAFTQQQIDAVQKSFFPYFNIRLLWQPPNRKTVS